MTATPQLPDIQQAFQRVFQSTGARPRVFRAPGRTNLIGEHTDYNDGFVFPAAIDRATWVAIAPRTDRMLRVYSEHFNETVEFDLRESSPAPRHHWTDYVRGVALMLERDGVSIPGAEMFLRSNVPLGAGLSSSASVEVASAIALLAVAGRELPKMEIARLCQRAENEFVGAHCGIMDQFVSCFGRSGHAIFLDCRSLESAAVPLPPGIRLVLCNTMVKHEIAGGDYNLRRRECEEAVARLARVLPGIRALRDVTPVQIEEHRALLPGVLYKRARHVTTEDARVLDARISLERGDLAKLGRLMAESHASLRDDYEVSCRELDVMVELANKLEGCLGARMTGGGFGGCTINLVRDAQVGSFVATMKEGYERATNIVPEIYSCSAADGAREII
jgi:galactokinase